MLYLIYGLMCPSIGGDPSRCLPLNLSGKATLRLRLRLPLRPCQPVSQSGLPVTHFGDADFSFS